MVLSFSSFFFSIPFSSEEGRKKKKGVGKGLEGTALSFVFRYLVDPASSDMLVSKIKPCTCQYKLLYGETANGSLNQL
jgi:hypothetical protein